MAKNKKRYYSDDDIERGITASTFRRLSRERQREYMLHWFHRNFEDPSNETPRDDGEFIYIWGGPYDAKDQLFNEFGDFIAEDRIDEVVERVQSDGTVYWAPGPDHPDHEEAARDWEETRSQSKNEPEDHEELDFITAQLEGGLKPTYGDRQELAIRETITDLVAQLDQRLRALPHGGIGHNRPPLDEGGQQPTAIDEAREAGKVIGTELAKAEPDALQVAKSVSRLRVAGGWLHKKADVGADSFVKAFGTTAGAAAATATVAAATYGLAHVADLIRAIAKQVTEWLALIVSAF
jgi:hypothetical protein